MDFKILEVEFGISGGVICLDVYEFCCVGKQHLSVIVCLDLIFSQRLELFIKLFLLFHFLLSLFPGNVPIFLDLQGFFCLEP